MSPAAPSGSTPPPSAPPPSAPAPPAPPPPPYRRLLLSLLSEARIAQWHHMSQGPVPTRPPAMSLYVAQRVLRELGGPVADFEAKPLDEILDEYLEKAIRGERD